VRILAAITVLAACSAATAGTPSPTLGHLIGQKLVVRMDGTTPSRSLLARARFGQIGGVIIHGFNFDSAAGLRRVTRELQQAAADGGQPPLLIGVDQEGPSAKAVAWIPPTLSPRQMDARAALAQGRSTGTALRALGVNTDFAPVADVPASPRSFLYRQGRTWSFSAHATAGRSGAFARGLRDGGAVATLKHFPGLGLATVNTDGAVVAITAGKAALAPGLRPYRSTTVPLIMLSNAVYTAYDRRNAAGWSRAIGTTLLRGELGFRGVTITDSLDGAAHARHVTALALALRAAKAGTDMALLTGGEEGTRDAYHALVAAAAAGEIDRAQLLASYRRILALKASLS
jgi:beta-N-acetylhexosaminidase